MRIAIPLVEGKLSAHFGHCETFALLDVDEKSGKVVSHGDVASPPHEPGALPAFLSERDVNVVITGGMGPRAVELFERKNIKVVMGAPADTPENIVRRYLDGSLESAGNACTHDEGHSCRH